MSQLQNRNQKQLQQQQQQNDLVPLMGNADLINLLASLEIQAYEEDFTKPTAQSTQMLFASLLDKLMGCPMEALDRPRTTLLGMMQYKELYFDALQFAMFFRHCRSLAILCGVGYFAQSDLTRPDSHRLRTILSAIMNYVKFREERIQFFEDLVVAVDQEKLQQVSCVAARWKAELIGRKNHSILSSVDALRSQVEKLEDQIAQINHRNEQDQPKVVISTERNAKIRDELFALRAEQQGCSASVENLKKEKSELLNEVNSRVTEQTDLAAANNAIKSRIVQSPERIKRTIADMSRTQLDMRANHANCTRKARELASRLAVIDGLELDLKSLIELEKGIDADRKRLDGIRRKIASMRDDLHTKNINFQSADARIEQLQRQIDNAGEKLKRQQDMAQEMRERSKAQMDSLKQQHALKDKERGVHHKELEIRQAEKKVLEDEMASYKDANERELNELIAEYQTTRETMATYMDTLQSKFGLQID